MFLKRFAIFDLKAEAFLPPFHAPTTGLACRMFEEAASSAEHSFHKHATDYTLFELGTFDQATGTSVDLPQQINLGLAASFINSNEALALVEDEI